MTQEIETVTFEKVVKIADADGVSIREGSVLREINDGDRGVVTWIGHKDTKSGPTFAAVGDLAIQKGPGRARITNRYSQWRHIPPDEQTYEERFVSWLYRRYEHDEFRDISEDEGRAIDGIMALLPSDAVDWEYESYPARLEDALRFLVSHLSRVSGMPN